MDSYITRTVLRLWNCPYFMSNLGYLGGKRNFYFLNYLV